MKKTTADTIIIGGGAAGMLAAALSAQRGHDTVLFEHGEYTGRKLRITGKGRCNVTNNCSVREVMDNTPTNGKFLFSCLNAFSPEDVISFFQSLGVKLKTERGNRVFPVSDKASDIVSALRRNMEKSGVQVIFDHVSEILTEGERVCGVKTKSGIYSARNVIVCTGGASYPLTGSTGDGYKMASALGHTIIQPKPSLVPLVSPDSICREMQGLSLRNVKLTAVNSKGKRVYEEQGEMLFTHFGITGPLVLSASSHMRNFDKETYHILIDLKPALDEKKLDMRLLRDFEKFSNRDFANSLGELVPKKMAPVIVKLSGISPDTKVNVITKKQRADLLSVLKSLKINISGPRPVDDAIITSGGISVKEIDPKTMESKIIKGLYFAGEIIDVDAYTGGFNLQIAWSTAYAAATHTEV